MLEGVQKELGKSEIKTKGHYTVKGVGNTPVTVYDECRTSIPLLDGSRQAVDALTKSQLLCQQLIYPELFKNLNQTSLKIPSSKI